MGRGRSALLGIAARSARPLRTRLAARREWRESRDRFLDAMRSNAVQQGAWWQVRTAKLREGAPTASWLAVHETLLEDVLTLPFLPDARPYVQRRVARTAPLPRIEGRPVGGSAAQVILLRPSGVVLLFDVEADVVTRCVPTAYSEDYRLRRDLFAKHVRSVPYELSDDRRSLIEPIVVGARLESLPSSAKLEARKVLLGQIERLAAASSGPSHSSRWLEGLLAGQGAVQVAPARAAAVSDWLGSAPLIPSHGDWSHNIIVDTKGPMFIDFDGIAMRPAWYDGLKLLLRTALGPREAFGQLGPALIDHIGEVTPVVRPSEWVDLLVLVGQAAGMVDADEADRLKASMGGWAPTAA